MKRAVSIELLQELFSYDAACGAVTWKTVRPKHRIAVGQLAGGINAEGYLVVNVTGNLIRLHRLAWLLHYGEWPAGNLDHVNGVRSDNRINNLRIADYFENQANTSARVTSKSGIKGVAPYRDRWQATIRVRGKRFHLGLFDRKEDAAEAYQEAARAHFGKFAREESPK